MKGNMLHKGKQKVPKKSFTLIESLNLSQNV